MARGEPDQSDEDRPVGLALGASLGAVCVAATLLVVWLNTDTTRPPPHRTEPFAGANWALRSLAWRGCDRAPTQPSLGPAGGTAAARLHADLIARGYVPEGEWSEPTTLPLTADLGTADGSCGVLAVATSAGDGYLMEGRVEAESRAGADAPGGPTWPSCSPEMAALGGCGAAWVRYFGSGHVRLRRYRMPGLTAARVEELGVPAEVALAHAEAEAVLRSGNWRGHPELVPVTVGGTGEQDVVPPRTPSSGCVPWVAVGLGAGRATARWDGAIVSQNDTPQRFMAGVVTCAGGPAGDPASSELRVWNDDPDARIWLRAFEVGPGLASPATPRPVLAGATLRDARDATLPASAVP